MSLIFELNQILKINLIPFGVENKKLEDLEIRQYDIRIDKTEKISEIKSSMDYFLYKYSLEPLIYYFAAYQNTDFRFRYLDFYHVIEYFFDNILVQRTLNIIQEELKNPSNFYEDASRLKFAISIKNELISKERYEFKEESILTKVLEKYLGSTEFQKVKSSLKILREIKKDDKNLAEITLSKPINELAKLLPTRIYRIRNAIAHSKTDFDWKIKPNSKEVLLLSDDIEILSNISKFLIKSFGETFKT